LVLGTLGWNCPKSRRHMNATEMADRFEDYWAAHKEAAAKAVIVSGWRSIETVEEIAREAFYAGLHVLIKKE
jgi:hypothetical protein